MCIAIMQKDKRRTGARMLIESGAIGDDPLILIKIQSIRVCLDFSKLDVDRALYVTCGVCIRTTHIDDNGLTGIKSSFGYIYRHARDLSLRERQIAR